IEWLASFPACLLSRNGPPVLVSCRSPLSESRALVTLASHPLPDCRRCREHRSVGVADLLQPDTVSALRERPAPGRYLGAGRSVVGRRSHVGAWFGGFSSAPLFDRGPAVVRPGTGRKRAAVEGQHRASLSRWETACQFFALDSCVRTTRDDGIRSIAGDCVCSGTPRRVPDCAV